MTRDNALTAHLRRIRQLVDPKNCARSSAKARKAALAMHAKRREKLVEENK